MYGGFYTRRYTLVHGFCFFKLLPVGCIIMGTYQNDENFSIRKLSGYGMPCRPLGWQLILTTLRSVNSLPPNDVIVATIANYGELQKLLSIIPYFTLVHGFWLFWSFRMMGSKSLKIYLRKETLYWFQ